MGSSNDVVLVNRAPVLTLWAAVVAERLGFDWDEALTLGKAVAGLTAQAKGRRLGIFSPRSPDEVARTRREKRAEPSFKIAFMGRVIPVAVTPEGIRALLKDRPIDPASVERYLRSKFGPAYERTLEAMKELAESYPPEELAEAAFELYERFRPEVPEGLRGWGAKGELSLQRIRSLRRRHA